MLTDAHLQNIAACIDFTRRNAPLSGEQIGLVGEVMAAIEAEIAARKTVEAAPVAVEKSEAA